MPRKLEGQNGARRYRPRSTVAQSACVPAHVPNSEVTGNLPESSEKLGRIRSILSNLGPDEAFFSIDEFGPFAVKTKPGLALATPGEYRVVPQWQKSMGCLIITAALELSGNQVTHFYSKKKNTAEMIRLMEMLIDQYRDRR